MGDVVFKIVNLDTLRLDKYGYLEIRDDFFEQDEIIALEDMPNGHAHMNILLRLYSTMLRKRRKHFTADEVVDFTGRRLEVVENALEIFKGLGLIE